MTVKTHRVPASGKHTVITNITPGSQVCLHIEAITFKQLWDNYVTGDPYDDPDGEYKNQCAIRMSATFHRVGIAMKSFSKKVVKPMPGKKTIGRILLDGKPTATRASELAEWLKLVPFCGLPGQPEDITGPDWERKIKGRTGIIFFGEYWTRPGEVAGNASGGHIDLWSGSRLTISGFFDSFAAIGRFFGAQSLIPGTDFGWSDLRKSKQILFWEVK